MKQYVFIFVVAIVLAILVLPFYDLNEEDNVFNESRAEALLNPESNPLLVNFNEENQDTKEAELNTEVQEVEEESDVELNNKEPSSNIFVTPIPNAKGEPKVEPIPNAIEGDYNVVPLLEIFKETDGEIISDSIGGL